MEKERLESLLIDYIDNALAVADRARVEAELLKNADARKLHDELRAVIGAIEQSTAPEPSDRLHVNFNNLLEKEAAAGANGKTILFRPAFYRVAAAIAFLLISGFVGFWISKNNQQQDRIAEMEREMELTRMQLAETRKLMFGMLENELSASQRIKGVNVAMEMSQPDDEIVKALMQTMLSDPNTNVRLASLEALARFQDDGKVRKGLIDALSKQTDPMVQIRLIQLMVQMKEKEVVNDLQRMVDDSETMKAVKDEAYNGILKLS